MVESAGGGAVKGEEGLKLLGWKGSRCLWLELPSGGYPGGVDMNAILHSNVRLIFSELRAST